MKGQEVKEILQSCGYSLKEIAISMEETPQNFQAMLKVEDIKTGVLERIATAINKNIMFFFSNSSSSNDEISIVNEIISNQKRINYLYQRIVDIDILVRDYLNIEDEYDYVEDAALIRNNMIMDKNIISEFQDGKYQITSWRKFDLSNKRIFCTETREAVRNLTEIFFDRFKVLYEKMRGKDLDL